MASGGKRGSSARRIPPPPAAEQKQRRETPPCHTRQNQATPAPPLSPFPPPPRPVAGHGTTIHDARPLHDVPPRARHSAALPPPRSRPLAHGNMTGGPLPGRRAAHPAPSLPGTIADAGGRRGAPSPPTCTTGRADGADPAPTGAAADAARRQPPSPPHRCRHRHRLPRRCSRRRRPQSPPPPRAPQPPAGAPVPRPPARAPPHLGGQTAPLRSPPSPRPPPRRRTAATALPALPAVCGTSLSILFRNRRRESNIWCGHTTPTRGHWRRTCTRAHTRARTHTRNRPRTFTRTRIRTRTRAATVTAALGTSSSHILLLLLVIPIHLWVRHHTAVHGGKGGGALLPARGGLGLEEAAVGGEEDGPTRALPHRVNARAVKRLVDGAGLGFRRCLPGPGGDVQARGGGGGPPPRRSLSLGEKGGGPWGWRWLARRRGGTGRGGHRPRLAPRGSPWRRRARGGKEQGKEQEKNVPRNTLQRRRGSFGGEKRGQCGRA